MLNKFQWGSIGFIIGIATVIGIYLYMQPYKTYTESVNSKIKISELKLDSLNSVVECLKLKLGQDTLAKQHLIKKAAKQDSIINNLNNRRNEAKSSIKSLTPDELYKLFTKLGK